jgi:hypothetical protein
MMLRTTLANAVIAIAIGAACTGALFSRNVAAALLAQESFSYGADTELLGKTGGTGFSAGWQAGPGNITPGFGGGTGGLSADNTSLSYPGGTLLSSSGARFRPQPAVSDNDFVRGLSTPIDMATDAVHYFSYLGNKQDLSASSDFLIAGFISNASILSTSAGTFARAAEIGWGSGDNILMATNPGATYASTLLTGKQIDKDLLFVLKIVSRAVGNDEVFGHVFSATAGDPFPDAVAEEPAAANWQITRTMNSSETLDRIRLMAGTNLGGQIDELRIGTTWADVVSPATLVPEPSIPTLLWAGVVGMIRIRCRRRMVLGR